MRSVSLPEPPPLHSLLRRLPRPPLTHLPRRTRLRSGSSEPRCRSKQGISKVCARRGDALGCRGRARFLRKPALARWPRNRLKVFFFLLGGKCFSPVRNWLIDLHLEPLLLRGTAVVSFQERRWIALRAFAAKFPVIGIKCKDQERRIGVRWGSTCAFFPPHGPLLLPSTSGQARCCCQHEFWKQNIPRYGLSWDSRHSLYSV